MSFGMIPNLNVWPDVTPPVFQVVDTSGALPALKTMTQVKQEDAQKKKISDAASGARVDQARQDGANLASSFFTEYQTPILLALGLVGAGVVALVIRARR